MPKPRKLNEASMMIMEPMRRVPRTKIEWMMLGRISLTMMALWDWPNTLAASTYSFVFSDMISPRTRRKNPTHPLKVRAAIR